MDARGWDAMTEWPLRELVASSIQATAPNGKTSNGKIIMRFAFAFII
jgi:hypothetical protein